MGHMQLKAWLRNTQRHAQDVLESGPFLHAACDPAGCSWHAHLCPKGGRELGGRKHTRAVCQAACPRIVFLCNPARAGTHIGIVLLWGYLCTCACECVRVKGLGLLLSCEDKCVEGPWSCPT